MHFESPLNLKTLFLFFIEVKSIPITLAKIDYNDTAIHTIY